MKAVSLVAAVLLFVLFIYVCFVAIAVHFIPHFFSWKLDMNLVLFLMLDALILQLISWVYKKLPAKPKNVFISWIEKVSVF